MAVNLSPVWGAGAQLFDNSGNVLSGGKIYTYAAGTSTPATTYTSDTGLTANSNPIVLNSAGRVPNEIWLTVGVRYKFVLKDSNDTLIGTWDNIDGVNSGFVAYTSQQEIQTATAGQTVFTLTTMEYLPDADNLTVFVDGVNQYGPDAQYAFTETDSTTVTFTNGLHVGALVKFTTAAMTSTNVVRAGGSDGQIQYNNNGALDGLSYGTAGQILTSAGAGNPPTWQSSGSGVTGVTATAPIASSGGATPNISITQASGSTNGYLSSTDWNTFNNKGSGTVTSVSATSPVASSGGTTPTISMPQANGSTSGYLSSTDWTTFNSKGSGTVTSVTGTAPISSSGGATPAISISQASGSTNGYLSSTDWTTFNNKQATLVSGTNIKTINSTSILGSGDLTVTATAAGSTGQLQYNNAGALGAVAAGTAGQVLTSAGAGSAPTWTNVSGTGDVVGPASATDNAIARFDTTTGKLIQNSPVTIDDAGNIISPDSVQFSGTPPVTQPIGALWFDAATDTLNLQQNAITQQIGEELYVYGKATATISGQTILQAIYKTGTVGASGVITFAPTVSGITDGGSIIGVATEDIATNGFGRITNFGIVHSIDTTGSTYSETWADGDDIWYNPVTGGLTKTKPVAPNVKVQIGTVIHAGSGGSGSFQVLLNTGSSLGGTDNNVQITSPASGNALIYDASAGYWKNANLTAGTGISVTNGAGSITVTNTSPDQTVSISSGTGINVTGTYPNFTVANSGVTAYPSSGIPVSTGSAWGTSKTAPSGDIVGTTDTQTLSGKTITGTKETVYTITDGAAFEIDPANGGIQTITLGASRTPAATNFTAGQSVTLMVDDGSAYTLTWTTINPTWIGGSAPTLATSGYTVLEFWKVGSTIYGAYVGTA